MSGQGLDRFGFDLPPASPRGPRQRTISRTAVHRRETGIFVIEAKYRRAKARATMVPSNAVRRLWSTLVECEQDTIADVMAHGAVRPGQQPDPHPPMSVRLVIAYLIDKSEFPGVRALPNVDEAMAGIWRAGFYFPAYYYPLQVLEIYFRAVERHGRTLVLTKEAIGDERGRDAGTGTEPG